MPANTVFYIQEGAVKLSVLSAAGKEAVVAMLGPETSSAKGAWPASRGAWDRRPRLPPPPCCASQKREMLRMLHEQHEFSDRFIAHVLARNIRIEEDLVDQLFNSSEKRLARTLLLLARYGKEDTRQRTLPKLSQETLAEMVGTTRSRVNYFMNKFRKLGFIEYNGGVKINNSLLSVVLHDSASGHREPPRSRHQLHEHQAGNEPADVRHVGNARRFSRCRYRADAVDHLDDDPKTEDDQSGYLCNSAAGEHAHSVMWEEQQVAAEHAADRS